VHEQAYCEHLRIVLNKGQLHLETGIFDITNCFPGGASLIHRSVFETYGLFDDAMFVGFEDYEYAVRAMLSVDGPLQVSTIQSIQLLHDHQFQKSSTDKESVKQRYNEERLQASYNRLTEKFRVHFDHDWHWWTQNQIQVMTEPKWKIKFKQLIARIIGC
jgi:GT2 family glycosyltransferase